jgi:arginyl-tRNA synthetase
MDQGVWVTDVEGAEDHPPFGGAHEVVHVIDARQSYLQKIVRAGLTALGHDEAARRSVHFAYEMVSLSPATARQLGVASEDGKAQEMSGRKGIGVKADDLIDRLEERAREEIAARNRELDRAELNELAREIAIAAVRFFMAKTGTTRVIAFDLDEALDFEGDSGPYLQYALVRSRAIERKVAAAGRGGTLDPRAAAALPNELWGDDLWDLVHAAAQIADTVEMAATTLVLSLVARLALELAQRFNALYHHHPVLHEEDEGKRHVRRVAFAVFARALGALADLLGIPAPARM